MLVVTFSAPSDVDTWPMPSLQAQDDTTFEWWDYSATVQDDDATWEFYFGGSPVGGLIAWRFTVAPSGFAPGLTGAVPYP